MLMTHIVAGYPTMKKSEEIALAMASAGVSYIEIQIPFSDPIADGPTIMQANQKALENGVTPNDCFELMKRLKKNFKTRRGSPSSPSEVKLLFMTYFNIPFRYGLESFCKKAKQLGCYGLIIPDMPIDEEGSDHYIKICKKYKLHPVQVISPITPAERLKRIAKVASGFVYCVAHTGTTGESTKLNSKLGKYLDRVRKHIKVPIALGFGISNKKQVKAVLKKADIAVIGSKIINLYKNSKGDKINSLKFFLQSLV